MTDYVEHMKRAWEILCSEDTQRRLNELLRKYPDDHLLQRGVSAIRAGAVGPDELEHVLALCDEHVRAALLNATEWPVDCHR